MRHIKFLAIMIATMVTIFSSCQKQDELSIDNVGQKLTAYAPGSGNAKTPETKVGFTEAASGNIELDWQVGDVITLGLKGNESRVGNFKVTQVDSDNGMATFEALNEYVRLETGEDYVAVYPALDEDAQFLWERDLNPNDYEPYDGYLTQSADGESMTHLNKELRMMSEPFQLGETMVFAHEMAIMSVTFDVDKAPNKLRFIDGVGLDSEREYQISLTDFAAGVSTVHFMLVPNDTKPRDVAFFVDGDDLAYSSTTKTTDALFEAGKHYTWSTAEVTPPPAPVGFPTGAVPAMATPRAGSMLMAPVSSSGFTITESNKASLSAIVFFIGYGKTGSGMNTKYKVFDDVAWSSSELALSRIKYLSLTSNATGGLALKLLRDLPTTPKTITITAKAPNGDKKTFSVILKGTATSTAPTSVELDRELLVANIGAEVTLVATVLPDEASTNKKLNWTSSDTSIATVDANGKVTTIADGETIITATTQEGAKTATCTVRVNGTDHAYTQYKIGDYYPNEYYPVGVVFMVDAYYPTGYGSHGKVISLDEFKAAFSTTDDRSVENGSSNGYSNMRAFYQTDSDFSDYPAYQWIAEKNEAGYTYPADAKGQWYLASDEELRHLIAGMCGYKMIKKVDLGGEGRIDDWSNNFPMNINGNGYTPEFSVFNKQITDAGGEAISGSRILVGSTIDHNLVFALTPSTGRVGGVSKNTTVTYVRAIMEF